MHAPEFGHFQSAANALSCWFSGTPKWKLVSEVRESNGKLRVLRHRLTERSPTILVATQGNELAIENLIRGL